MTTEAGGPGVRNLIHVNQALLGKWLWRFAIEGAAWWKKLVVAKYDIMKGGCCSKEVGGSHGVGVWKGIRGGWDIFKQYVRFVVRGVAVDECIPHVVYHSMCKGGIGGEGYGCS